MRDAALDRQVRTAAFQWLAAQQNLYGEVLARALLARGFDFKGRRVPLVSPQGIFKPALLDLPLTITTVPGGPYPDRMGASGLLEYRYRGADPRHRDNVGLRRCLRERLPLVYLYGIIRGRYLPVWPVYIVEDRPSELTFRVAVDEASSSLEALPLGSGEPRVAEAGVEARRSYLMASVLHRVHQHSFREKVLRAYREQCALCRLRHRELLDAAHIIGDREETGEPVVSNGLALCKLHHSAFDRYFIGIRPDYTVEVRRDILEEEDGPLLQHGLQGLQGKQIWTPGRRRLRPDPERLAARFARFLQHSA